MTVTKVKIILSQSPDSCDEGDDPQELEIESHDAGAGAYLTISTGRWALDPDDIDAFTKRLLEVLAMVDKEDEGE